MAGGGGRGGVSGVSGIRTCIARGSSGSTATLNINKLNLLDYKAGTVASGTGLPGRKVPTAVKECTRGAKGIMEGRKKEPEWLARTFRLCIL